MIRWAKFIALSLRKKSALTTGEQALLRDLNAQDEAVGDRIARWYFHGLIALGVIAIFTLALMGTCRSAS
jgi:hypothetical protein